ncbi:MAG: hypothetical protein HUU16_08245 [Candidatus Omnitrophica bacterium]|nr:hypothetical protein [Candidatus Omnitrophota bacterium]
MASCLVALCLGIPTFALDIYSTDFEQSEGFSLGELGPGGVNGWGETEGTGASAIVDTLSFAGDQSLEIAAGAAVQRAVTATESILYVDGRYSPPLSDNYPALPIASPASAFFIFHAQDGLVGLDGDGAGGGVWAQAGIVLGAGFHRLTIRLDFTTQTWDLWMDGQPTFSGFGFKDSSVTQLNGLRIDSSQSAPGHLDTVVIGTDLPDFLVPTPTVTSTPSPSPSFTATRTPTPTSSLTPTASPSASPSPTSTDSFTATPSRTSTNTLAPTQTRTPSATSTASPSATHTASQTASPSGTPSPSVTASTTPTRSETPTQGNTSTETEPPTGTPTETVSEIPTVTESPQESATPTSTSTETESPTESESPTETSTLTETQFGEPTATETHSPTATRTPVDPNQVDHFLFQFAMQFQESVDQGNEMFEQPNGDGHIEASDLLYWLALLKGN